MAFLFTCGFECGHVGLTGPAGGGTKHFTAGNGTPSIVTANMPGAWSARAMRFTASAGNNIWRSRNVTATNGYSVIKGRIKFIGSLPSANCYFLFIDHTGACSDVRLLFRSSNSKVVCKVEPGAAGDEAEGPVVAADTWYYFEIRARPNNSSTNLVVDWKWDGTAQTSINAAGRTANGEQLSRLIWGTNIEGVSSANATIEFDDLLIGDATGDYDGVKYEIKGYLAASDGTHSFDASDGTDFKKGTIGSLANAASSDTDLNQSVDELAGDNTTALSADGPEAGEYTATKFAQESVRTAAPVFVETVISHRNASATTANKTSARLYDGSTTADLYTDVSIGTATTQILGYGRAAAPSGAWTIALLNALQFRWGGSWSGTPDVSPVPYLTSVLLEVAHPPGFVSYSHTPSGGLQAGGAAAHLISRSVAGAGGLTFAGAGGLARSIAPVASGGVTFAGSAGTLRVLMVAPTGGVLFAGAAPIHRDVIVVPGGGLTFAGGAAAARGVSPNVSGGLSLSGSALVSRLISVLASGGLSFQGAAAVARAIDLLSSGGLVFGGDAVTEFDPGLLFDFSASELGVAPDDGRLILTPDDGALILAALDGALGVTADPAPNALSPDRRRSTLVPDDGFFSPTPSP